MQKGSVSADALQFSKNYQQERRKRGKKTTKQVMIDLRILQWRKERSRGHAGTLNPECHEYQTAKHHFRNAQKNEFAGCAER